MKHLFFIICLFLYATVSLAQDKVYESGFNVSARFGNNYDDLDRWIARNRIYPQEAIFRKEEGIVDVSFIVEKDGSLSSIEIKNSVSPSLDAEVMRLVSIMPKWRCAYIYGVPCRSRDGFSVYFRLPKMESKALKEALPSQTQLTYNSSSIGDIWACKNGQKIYEGEYELFGRSGKAKYQYRDGPNRSRIFDGHFIFQGNYGAFAEGNFKDNHQIGNWLFKGSPLGKVKITFNEESRIVVGEFQDIRSSGKFMRANDGHLNGRMIYANERKNRIIQFKYENNGFYGCGEYDNDGHEKGTWYYREKKGEPTKTTIYNNHGKVLESYYIDNTTGDKVPSSTERCRNSINDILELHWERISSFFLRSTQDFY